MKTKVLFVSQTMGHKQNCGIGIMGKLIGETLLGHPELEFNFIYSDDIPTVHNKINEFNPEVVIYNYAPTTTTWVDDWELRRDYQHIKHGRLMHDAMCQRIADEYTPEKNSNWNHIIADDPQVVGNEYVMITNRLMPGTPTVKYVEPERPIIGFQGFGFVHKGIDRIAHQVVKEFDEAVIRLHIPYSFYGDPNGQMARTRVAEVQHIVAHKPGIQVIATFDLMSTQEIIDLLAQNTVNCYFYHELTDVYGTASSPDYGLAARRPMAVTRSYQMRNYWHEPRVQIEHTSLREIIANGTEVLEPFYKAYSKESVWADYSRVVRTMLASNKS